MKRGCGNQERMNVSALSAGPEAAAYWRGTEFRMGGYDIPAQIAASDGPEGNGGMGVGFIVLENPTAIGSIRVGPTEEGTDTIWEVAKPLEEQWESLKVNESKVVEQESDDEERQASKHALETQTGRVRSP